MARPQSPDYDKRREAIVATAASLYARRGFQGASVSDLAKACGTSKSLIYHYFPAKDDILYEVITALLDELVETADEAVKVGHPEKRLRSLTAQFIRIYSGSQDAQRVLLNELDNLPAERRAEVVAKQRRLIAIVEALVREVRPSTASLPITMLFFGMINWTHTWFRPEGRVSPDALADMAVDLMLGGLPKVQAS